MIGLLSPGARVRIFGSFALLLLAGMAQAVSAQARSGQEVEIPVTVRYVATEANAPPGTCGCFWLQGGAADAAVPLFRRLSVAVEVAGVTVSRVPASARGLSEITLLAGPRYAVPLRHGTLNAHALFGAVRGFDADFVAGPRRVDTSTNFAMALGGAFEVRLSRRLGLRVAEVDFLQTNLPNGAGDRQRSVRVGAGIVFHVPLPVAR